MKSIKSLSARRAWIEIADLRGGFGGGLVALRKESVDRNLVHVLECPVCFASLSARRAWIEIKNVAKYIALGYGRSPQGERG